MCLFKATMKALQPKQAVALLGVQAVPLPKNAISAFSDFISS